jgi:hypothetical protein
VQSSGWKPNSQVDATMNSTPVSLGTLTADGSGAVSGQFTVPAGMETGSHTVVLTGQDPNDESRTVTIALTVSTTPVTTTPTGTNVSSGGTLAFTGSTTRNLVSIALLLIAVGCFLLGRALRERGAASG